MSQLVRKEYQCDPTLLAKWLEGQPGTWWSVDGDPYLTSSMEVPCPVEELAERLASEKKPIVVITDRSAGDSDSVQTVDQLDKLADRVDRDDSSSDRVLLCRWMESEEEWLLVEDQEAAVLFGGADDETD